MNDGYVFTKLDARQAVVALECAARDDRNVIGNDDLGFFSVIPYKLAVADLAVAQQIGVKGCIGCAHAVLDFISPVVFLSMGINRGCHPLFAKRVAFLL